MEQNDEKASRHQFSPASPVNRLMKSPLKITHLSTYPVGGAAIAARRLHEGMLALELDSTFYTLHPGGNDIAQHAVYHHHPSIVQNISARLRSGRFKRQEAVKAALPKRYDWFSFTDSGLYAENDQVIQDADVLVIHWCSDWLNWESFFKAIGNKRVILVMHDMNHATGGCHYSLGCEQFTSFCRNCPQVDGLHADDLVHRNFTTRLKIFQERENMAVSMPSHWMANNARASRFLSDKKIVKINYGLNTEIFKLENQSTKSDTVIGFVADSLANQRKGFTLLIEALELLKPQDNPIKIRVMGAHAEGFTNLPFPIDFVGKVSGDENLAAFYNSLDLFVIPSSYDNQPNTVIEALCCGVPVVGFPGSGVAEMVSPGVSGVIATAFSSKELALSIEEALALLPTFKKEEVSQTARATYDMLRMAQEYFNVAESLLA